MTVTKNLATAKSAAEVRKALVRELRAERAEYQAMDLRAPAVRTLAMQARVLAVVARNPELMESDRNGITKLEIEVMRAVAEIMMRAYWPHVARMWSIGAGKKTRVHNVDALNYDGLIALYNSIGSRLVRESITNAAWRDATAMLNAARKVTRGK